MEYAEANEEDQLPQERSYAEVVGKGKAGGKSILRHFTTLVETIVGKVEFFEDGEDLTLKSNVRCYCKAHEKIDRIFRSRDAAEILQDMVSDAKKSLVKVKTMRLGHLAAAA